MNSESAIKSAVTISLVPEAKQGPFVYHGEPEACVSKAATHGFDGIEIFAPSASEVSSEELRRLLGNTRLAVAAFGTGAGWVVRKLTLTSPDRETRAAAQKFVEDFLDLAGDFGASVIIGSMQGRIEPTQNRDEALAWLKQSIADLSVRAKSRGVQLLLEPLNRYETNIFNQLGATVEFIKSIGSDSVKVLADLFHMNIEEPKIGAALEAAAPYIGHIHLADSNRQAFGFGHTDIAAIRAALRSMKYSGYLSAEIFPLPDADTAAIQTLKAIDTLKS